MSAHGLFVAGTDTGVGKTRISGGLLRAQRNRGYRVAGMKPVAAGAILRNGRMISEDAVTLEQEAGQITPYEWLNPYCLELAESPHLAAARVGVTIDLEVIAGSYRNLEKAHDWVLVEGAGGWYSPISQTETMADIALKLELPVVLVVGLRLGCLNQALLSMEAIRNSGLPFAGWIGSTLQHPWEVLAANVATLSERLGGAPLGVLPWSESAADDQLVLAPAAASLLP